MNKKAFLTVGITLILLLAVSAVIMIFARGYIVSVDDGNVKQTGILSINSTPSSALIYVNNVPKDVTDNSITGLSPETYTVRLEKTGYHTWEKEVEVAAGEVSNVQALLISSFPEIKPLSITGARNPKMSPDEQKIIYIARQSATRDDEASSGIWLMDLAGRPFNILSAPKLILADTATVEYSSGAIQWGADSESLLIDMPNETSYLLNTGNEDLTTLTPAERTALLEEWQLKQEEDLALTEEQFTNEIRALLPPEDKNPVWSPDETKVLYTEENDGQIEYKILDLRPEEYKGIAKSESDTKLYSAMSVSTDQNNTIRWYPDSRHLIMFEESSENIGQISIVEIEGTNRTSLFSGRVIDGETFPHPDGSKVIFLTNFTTSDDQNNLYSLSVY